MTSRRRIALIGEGIVGGGIKGQGVPVLRNLVETLCGKYEVVLYTLIPVKVQGPPAGLSVRAISPGPLPVRIRMLWLVLRFLIDHFTSRFSLIFAVSAFPSGRLAVALGRILRRPSAVLLTTAETAALASIGFGELLQPKLRRINKHVCDRADALIMLSQYQKNIAVKELGLTRNVEVIPLMIRVDRFPFNPRKVSTPIRFLHVAYFHPVKDQMTLFEAFAIIAESIDCRLSVVGDGFDDPAVSTKLDGLGIAGKVDFHGSVLYSQIPELFRGAHVLLHTSRYETQGAVILEAMASGVPVCGTSVGLLSDLGADLVVAAPVGDPRTLASKVLGLLRDPLRFEALQLKARAFAEAHSSVWSGEKYLKLFQAMTETD